MLSRIRSKTLHLQFVKRYFFQNKLIPLSNTFHRNFSLKMVDDKAINKSQYVLPNTQPVGDLDCAVAFRSLTDKEKLYAHHIAQVNYLFAFSELSF